jgi:hypothetical protein
MAFGLTPRMLWIGTMTPSDALLPQINWAMSDLNGTELGEFARDLQRNPLYEAEPSHEILEARIGMQCIERWPHED